ncbi:MAG: hypothetical protein SCK70_12570, partial [bacterium]|nr:hypothetical protein [bacterium]
HFSPCSNDLLGVRVIAFYLEDVDRIADLIESNFKIHLKNFEYEAQHRAPDQFGYSSKHYKISLLNNFGSSKLEKFKDIVFEVQIRTIAQHAWSIIDHKIRYKTTEKIPHDIQRQIFQLSALFEMADSQFYNINQKLESNDQLELIKYKNSDLTAKINKLTLGYYLENHKQIIQPLVDEALNFGFNENAFQQDANSIRYLLMVLKRLKVESVGEVEAIFEQARIKGPAIMKKIYQLMVSDKNINSFENSFPIILLVIIMLKLATIQFKELDARDSVEKLLSLSIKSISLSLEKNTN